MPVEPKNPPPLYAPETAARVILHCAETPKRDVFVGAGGKGISLLGRFAPHLADKIMERTMIKQQQSNRPAGASQENGLYRSSGDLKERGGLWDTWLRAVFIPGASLHPVLTGSALVGAGLAAAAFLRARRAGGR